MFFYFNRCCFIFDWFKLRIKMSSYYNLSTSTAAAAAVSAALAQKHHQQQQIQQHIKQQTAASIHSASSAQSVNFSSLTDFFVIEFYYLTNSIYRRLQVWLQPKRRQLRLPTVYRHKSFNNRINSNIQRQLQAPPVPWTLS